jgi:hypothetical protein
MLTWMRKRKLNKLSARLAGVEVQIREETRFGRRTGLSFPVVLAALAREQADLSLQIEHVKARLPGARS